jgi:deoxycytidylate deaminase
MGEIQSRITDELVIALCGAVGSGVSTVGSTIKQILEQHNYNVYYVKLSDFIKRYARSSSQGSSTLTTDGLNLQDKGNELREQHSCDILAQLAIYKIAMDRARFEGDSCDEEQTAHKVRREAVIIDSLKNPEEWRLLQTIYGRMFYLFGVLCPETIRKERLIDNKSISKVDAESLIERDKSEKSKYGQQLMKTIFHADFFVRNMELSPKNLKEPLKRYIGLILSDNKYVPTVDEYAMHAAQSSANRSSCLSRQVGAAIVDSGKNIIATGRNDVPKVGGGLYEEGDKGAYNCTSLGGCKSDQYKMKILDEIKRILSKSLGDIVSEDKIRDAIEMIGSSTKIRDIIEFSRAVHAEMDAITTVARKGIGGLEGATLYCTTFPCHHCARHIVASGIKRVFYIEPYEKSLAKDLHKDSIILDSADTEIDPGKVKFLPFEGVAPKQFMNIFCARKKKEDGKSIDVNLANSSPILSQLMDSFVDYEDRVVKRIAETKLIELVKD